MNKDGTNTRRRSGRITCSCGFTIGPFTFPYFREVKRELEAHQQKHGGKIDR